MAATLRPPNGLSTAFVLSVADPNHAAHEPIANGVYFVVWAVSYANF